jgi:methylglutaconyl-CoA hydratase
MKKFLKTFIKDQVQYIILSRPDKGNAYHAEMALEIKLAFEETYPESLKAVVLTAEGKNFCTGADLDWMEKKLPDMDVIRDMYLAILSCPHPIVGKVYGKIRGGGLGLTASCDVVIASPETDFALTEVKHGLIPGMITPMLLAKTNEGTFQDWSTSGRQIPVNEAKSSGLVTYLEKEKTLEDVLSSEINIHPLRKDIKKIESDLNHYLKLSSEHRKQMIRANGIS